jgi:pimeloyl-ACP methyl ester carboxylesterase
MSSTSASISFETKLTELADGRKISFREYGDVEGGYPVIFMHGNLNSSKFHPSWEKTEKQTTEAGAHVFALDRPGVGETSFSWDKRTYLSWAADVKEFAEIHDLSSFAVAGYSSGGPHAMACALGNVPNVSALGLVSSDGPYRAIEAEKGGDEGIIKGLYKVDSDSLAEDGSLSREKSLSRCQDGVKHMKDSYSKISREHRREIAIEDINWATSQGVDGPASDSVLETSEWGFQVEDITVPTFLWHGKADPDVPVFVADFLLSKLPNLQKKTIVDTENHTMVRRSWTDILTSLIEVGKASGTKRKGTKRKSQL